MKKNHFYNTYNHFHNIPRFPDFSLNFSFTKSDNVKLCYMDTDRFIMHIKTKDFYEDIADEAEKKI